MREVGKWQLDYGLQDSLMIRGATIRQTGLSDGASAKLGRLCRLPWGTRAPPGRRQLLFWLDPMDQCGNVSKGATGSSPTVAVARVGDLGGVLQP